jgi:hypothetical protein
MERPEVALLTLNSWMKAVEATTERAAAALATGLEWVSEWAQV